MASLVTRRSRLGQTWTVSRDVTERDPPLPRLRADDGARENALGLGWRRASENMTAEWRKREQLLGECCVVSLWDPWSPHRSYTGRCATKGCLQMKARVYWDPWTPTGPKRHMYRRAFIKEPFKRRHSLRSKRFCIGLKYFSRFERAKLGASSVALAPIFAPPKNEKCLERAENLRKRLLRRLEKAHVIIQY